MSELDKVDQLLKLADRVVRQQAFVNNLSEWSTFDYNQSQRWLLGEYEREYAVARKAYDKELARKKQNDF